MELNNRLKGLIVAKMEEVRRMPDIFENLDKYEEFYGKNFEINIRNEIEDANTCKDIQ